MFVELSMIEERPSLRAHVRRGIVRQVRALFNDRKKGEEPVERSSDALFAPDSMIWRVHGDVTTMMIGGVTALLLQMLHPAVLAGVWDHSSFRTDMLGRLRRTARFIAITTYGDRQSAAAAIAQVRMVHGRIGGTLADGTCYKADDAQLLAWVHVTEAWSFLAAWQRYGDRPLSASQQDRYFAEFATVGAALGANPVPRTRSDAERLLQAERPRLASDARTREVARLVLNHPPRHAFAIPVQRVTMQAAVDLLPGWARRMHGLAGSAVPFKPLVSTGALGLARTLRWAFADSTDPRRL
jgi:uncharacterized protein (DUF2236 family)